MKIRNLLSFTIYLLLCAPVWSQAQEANVTINLSNTRISEVFEEIETQTSYTVAYNESVIDPSTRINVSLSNKPLSQAMTEILSGLNAMFRIEGKKILILSAPSAPMYSDRKTVSGKVVDTHGEPIIGANIVESGTTNGTTTDIDGNFSLEVASNALLTLTYIGYTQQELSVSNRTVFKLVMHENAQTLEEVVVVGYGVQKKKLVTGATIHVSGEDVSKMNSTSVLGALQSQSPGLSITKTSGQPGSDFKVSIRGIGTTGNSTPLFIVDGVTVGNISNLNTADIEAIDVLKDAASSAIYGSRAANGVILITTKQGEKGKVSLQYDGYYAIQTTYRMPKPLNAQDYAMIMSESARNSGLPDFDYAKLVPDWNKIESGQWSGTNWLEEITNNKAPMQNHSLNLTGGNEHGKYSMGLSYLDQLGIIGKPANPYYQRYTFRINTEFVVAKNRDFDILKIGESLTYSYTKRSGNLSTGGANNNIRSALATNPFLPMYDETGEYHYTLPWFEPHANPYAIIDYAQKNRENLSQAINGRIYVSIQPIKDLILLSGFGINTISDYARSYTPTFHIGSDPAHIQTIDIVSQSQSSSLRWIFDTTLNYKKGFAQNMLSVMVGMSAERSGIGQNISGSNQGSVFDSFKFAYLDNVPTISPELTTLGGAPLVETRLLSFFSRLNYDYKETYMLSLIFRADGSSNFAPNNRWAYFPSVSAGWVITNTDFIMRAIPRMGFLKLRASWGQNGNSAISPFQYLGTINMSDGIAVYFPGIDKSLLTQGAYPDIAPNPDIKWETSEQLNIGFDSRFFNSKLYINFDWYNKMTKDWLVRAPILGSSGTGAPYITGGDVRNTGFEILTGWQDNKGEFFYGVHVNMSHNKNEITRIANSEGIIHGATSIVGNGTPEFYRAQVGFPIGYFWALKTNGIFQNQAEIDAYVNSNGAKIMPNAKPGDLKFVNQDDNNTIDEKDRIMVGSPHPKYRFGFSFEANYKGFDFAITTAGALGQKIFKSYRNIQQRPLDNYTTEILGRWTGEGSSNTIPRVMQGNHINDSYISDRYIENGDYWRCSNLTIGYDFKKLFKSVSLQQMRLYVSAQNLFILTPYSGIDPEVGQGNESWASGIDIGFYPSPRTYLLGATIKF